MANVVTVNNPTVHQIQVSVRKLRCFTIGVILILLRRGMFPEVIFTNHNISIRVDITFSNAIFGNSACASAESEMKYPYGAHANGIVKIANNHRDSIAISIFLFVIKPMSLMFLVENTTQCVATQR